MRRLLLLLFGTLAACVQLFGGDEDPTFANDRNDGGPIPSRSTPEGGTLDADATTSGGGRTWCATNHPPGQNRECLDFDIGESGSYGQWETAAIGPFGALVSSDRSAPYAFGSKSGSGQATSYLTRTFSVTAFETVRLGFDLRHEGCQPAVINNLASIAFYDSNSTYVVGMDLVLNKASDVIARLCRPPALCRETAALTRVPGSWSAYILELTAVGTAFTADVMRDGDPPPGPLQATATTTPAVLQLKVGHDGAATVADCTARFDNVWFEREP